MNTLAARADVFAVDAPADVEQASLIREEAIDWLESRFSVDHQFRPRDILAFAGESERRWLLPRLRAQGLIQHETVSLAEAADALAVLNLRSRGVKFGDAIEAVSGGAGAGALGAPRYGGIWNRLAVVAQASIQRMLPARLLASAILALVQDRQDQSNALVIIEVAESTGGRQPEGSEPVQLDQESVYRALMNRPPPSCAVFTPGGELLFFDRGQVPSRSELASRAFAGVRIATERATYHLVVGSLRPPSLAVDERAVAFVGRILDLVLLDLERFAAQITDMRIEASTEPALTDEDDLRLWIMTQLVSLAYPGSLCEVIGTSTDTAPPRVLASSAARPWEPRASGTPRTLDMLADYAGRIGVPLLVQDLTGPLRDLVSSVDAELRYLRSLPVDRGEDAHTAVALPIVLSSGDAAGALYLIGPRWPEHRADVEARVLGLFARVVGEILERQRAAKHSGVLSANIATSSVLGEAEFRDELQALLERTARDARRRLSMSPTDLRLPFLLLSAHRPQPDELEASVARDLADWLVGTLKHLDWRSFVSGRLAETATDIAPIGFMGELPGVGMMIALDHLVTKDELDQMRSAFPTAINNLAPANSPVRLLAWVLDVPAARVVAAETDAQLEDLRDEITRWASEGASALHEVVGSSMLAHDEGDWEGALRLVRRALRHEGGRGNTYLQRIGAECSFALGDWPSALEFAERAVELSEQDPLSGWTRSLCLLGDAHLLLLQPERAWARYDEATERAPTHPLPRYYRGQAGLLVARLLHECQASEGTTDGPERDARIRSAINALSTAAMDDLEAASSLLENWGLIPELYQYRNFHLVPTLLAQGTAYRLRGEPGPAASRLESARRAFPKDDLFFREYLFAKCCERRLHLEYGALIAGGGWTPAPPR